MKLPGVVLLCIVLLLKTIPFGRGLALRTNRYSNQPNDSSPCPCAEYRARKEIEKGKGRVVFLSTIALLVIG